MINNNPALAPVSEPGEDSVVRLYRTAAVDAGCGLLCAFEAWYPVS